MCWGIVWLAWWWRDGKGSSERKRCIEFGGRLLQEQKGKNKRKTGTACRAPTVTFRGNSRAGDRLRPGRRARARPSCRALCFRRGGKFPASGTSQLRCLRRRAGRGLVRRGLLL